MDVDWAEQSTQDREKKVHGFVSASLHFIIAVVIIVVAVIIVTIISVSLPLLFPSRYYAVQRCTTNIITGTFVGRNLSSLIGDAVSRTSIVQLALSCAELRYDRWRVR